MENETYPSKDGWIYAIGGPWRGSQRTVHPEDLELGDSTSYANIQADMAALICANVLPVDDLVLDLS